MNRVFRNLFIVLTLAVGLAASGMHTRSVSAVPVANSPTYYVTISSSGFNPNSLIIARNSTVVFTNSDSVNHGVDATNAAGAGPSSPAILPGQSYSFAFNNLGPFNIVDSLNKNATAYVTVVVAGDPNITTPNAPSDTTKGSATPPTSASGSVAAGYETSMLAYIPAFILGTLCIVAAGILLVARHSRITSGHE